MGRAPCCEKVGLKKGPWTPEEDQKLTAYVNEHGHGSWRALPKKAGLLRCGKSCRLRWTNYLRPGIKRGEFSSSEEQTIIQLHALLGNRWSAIATHLPKRTDNEIKNYWNTHLKKRLIKMGLDPVTHKPPTLNTIPNNSTLMDAPNNSNSSSAITHMAQWESVRLEAEARLAKEAEMRSKGVWQPAPSVQPHDSDRANAKLDACAFASMDLLKALKQACRGGVMSSKREAGSCDAINRAKLSVGTLATSLKLNPCALMVSPKQEEASIVTELVNSLHNWENSLQGQAGLMWPDSWKLCGNASNSGEGQDSSSCSSPSQTMNYGSPTSTLRSLEQLSKHSFCLPYNSMPSTQARSFYWSDNYLHSDHNALIHSSKALSSAQVNGGTQGVESIKGDSAEGILLELPCIQELMECESYKGRGDSLLIASNSSGFLSDLELVSEDISSSHQSSSVADASGGDICQISYSAFLGEEYPDCEWNSVLKESEDALEDQMESSSL